MKRIETLIYHFFLLVLTACGSRTAEENRSPGTQVMLRYAEGFRISAWEHATLAEVITPFQGAKSGYAYLLVPHGKPVPDHPPHFRVLRTPVTEIVCTSTTHIPLLDYLGETNSLTGFPTTDYISSKVMRARIDAGAVTDLGIDNALSLERLSMLSPDMVMGYTMTSEYGQFKKIEELGIPVIINAEYLERHPLGRAEWIKFMAVFFGKQERADSVFDTIEKNYLRTKALATGADTNPTAMMGIVYGDTWYLPGGGNNAARLLNDAAIDYLWKDTDATGSLELSFESVYEKAHNADIWIGTGSFASLAEIMAADHRYSRFSAFQTGQIYNYNARIGPGGGNEFLELGYLRPDLVLMDLVAIAHPRLLPRHTLYFHRKLH